MRLRAPHLKTFQISKAKAMDNNSGQVVLVKDINLGSSYGAYPSNFKELNGKLYFSASDRANGRELWETDGTTQGTQLVANIAPGAIDSSPYSFTVVNDKLYFIAQDRVNGRELWISDGTSDGTQLVKDIKPGFNYSYLNNLTELNGKLYFSADDGENGNELWVSDGTSGGTQLLKDIRPGFERIDGGSPYLDFPYGSVPMNFQTFQDKLYFSAEDDGNVRKLWVSDGTSEGTQLFKDISSPSDYSNNNFTEFNGKLYFAADDGTNGTELWVSDGTSEGTQLLKDISLNNNYYSGSFPADFIELNGKLYFSANDRVNGRELWVSDGTTDGTQLFKNINLGASDSSPRNFIKFQDKLYFTAGDGVNGRELWVSDGTTQGTQLLKDINPGLDQYGSINTSYPDSFVEVRDKLYFVASNEVNGRELWVTDGTTDGTQLVTDIKPGAESSDLEYLTEFNGELYFSAESKDRDRELYKLTFEDSKPTPTDNVIIGTSDSDNLTGTDEADRIDALSGDDTVVGGDGNDTLLGRQGKDFLRGNNGDDELKGEGGSDRLFGQSGNDFLFGGDGDDFLEGNSGNDTLNGNTGKDFLLAGAGSDRLQGGDGNDFLSGNSGNDTLIGGKGNDILVGGGGKDIFAIATNLGRIIISDFTNDQDKLGLSGNLAFDDLAIVQNTTTTIDDIQGDALVGLRGRNFNTSDTLIKDSQDKLIAVLLNVDATDITSEDFLSI